MRHKFRVRTGGLYVTVKAVNHQTAAIKAIDKHIPEDLGTLIAVLKDGDKQADEVYMTSKYILECMGFKIN